MGWLAVKKGSQKCKSATGHQLDLYSAHPETIALALNSRRQLCLGVLVYVSDKIH